MCVYIYIYVHYKIIKVIGPTLDQFHGWLSKNLFPLRWGWCLERWDDKAAWEFWKRSKSCCNNEARGPWKVLKLGYDSEMTKMRSSHCKNYESCWGGQRMCNTIIYATYAVNISKQYSKWIMLIVVKLKKPEDARTQIGCEQHLRVSKSGECRIQDVPFGHKIDHVCETVTRISSRSLHFSFKGGRHYLMQLCNAVQSLTFALGPFESFPCWSDGELMVSWQKIRKLVHADLLQQLTKIS